MIGGIFIKANDPKYLARWYEDNLGIGFGTGIYFSFKWRNLVQTNDIGYTVFSFFPESTDYFYLVRRIP
jgi:glyoxylase I family protein